MKEKNVVTIREAGKMSFDDKISDGRGMRNAKKLLKNLSIEFAKRSRIFFDASGDLPYIYREKQLHSILVPILWDTNDLVMTELPAYRLSDSDEKKKLGWVDYLVKKGNTTFLIELKHSYFGYKAGKLRQSSLNEWSTAINQINTIDSPEQFKINSADNVVAIALNVITIYSSSNIEVRSPEKCESIYNRIDNSFDSIKPNFIAKWNVHDDMMIPYEWIDGKKEFYPYVHIIAQVKNLD